MPRSYTLTGTAAVPQTVTGPNLAAGTNQQLPFTIPRQLGRETYTRQVPLQ